MSFEHLLKYSNVAVDEFPVLCLSCITNACSVWSGTELLSYGDVSGFNLPLPIWYDITLTAAPSVFNMSVIPPCFRCQVLPLCLLHIAYYKKPLTICTAEKLLLIVMTAMLPQLFAFVGSLDTKLMILNSGLFVKRLKCKCMVQRK